MKLVDSYRVQLLANVEVPLANKFYREYGFRGKAKRYEPCAVVRDKYQAIIACGYVRDYQTFKLLAGLAVAPVHQGNGVARLLIQKLSPVFDTQTYTFPYKHLQPFYESLGFRVINVANDTSPVNTLYQCYRTQGRDITMMVFATKSIE